MTTANAQAREMSSTTARTSFGQVLMAEWAKFSSLRSNVWTLVATVVTTIGIGLLFVFTHLDLWTGQSAAELAAVDPLHESFSGLWFAGILGFAVIGTLAMASEYSSGTISSTFAAVPRRLHVLGAKAAVAGAVAFIVGTLTSVAAFFAAQPLLARESLDVAITDNGVLFAILGGGIYATGATLLGVALGAILRRTVTTLIVLTAVFPLATTLDLSLPDSWSSVTQYLPHAAGLAVMSSIEHFTLLSPVAGLLVLTGWTVAALITAGILLQRRDAAT